MIITIDGPAGSGKSTVAKALARRLGFAYLDTGAMYRAVALQALQQGIDIDDAEAAASLAAGCDVCLRFDGDQMTVRLAGRDVTAEIRDPQVTAAASRLAGIPQVRQALVQKQRRLARQMGDLVSEGRDQGSVVFPHAEVKFFLDAAPHVRAERRYKELIAQGRNVTFQQVLDEQQDRDRRDCTRDVSPLVVPENAIVVDTSPLTIEQVVSVLLEHVQKRQRQ